MHQIKLCSFLWMTRSSPRQSNYEMLNESVEVQESFMICWTQQASSQFPVPKTPIEFIHYKCELELRALADLNVLDLKCSRNKFIEFLNSTQLLPAAVLCAYYFSINLVHFEDLVLHLMWSCCVPKNTFRKREIAHKNPQNKRKNKWKLQNVKKWGTKIAQI